MPFFRGRKAPEPTGPRLLVPETIGAYLFTLRSVPRHHDGIRAAIESTGDARVYFSEPLAYIGGKGVSLFRVEATGFSFLGNLYDWWRQVERDEATGFDIDLYVYNRRWLANLRAMTAQQVESVITEHAPRFEGDKQATARR